MLFKHNSYTRALKELGTEVVISGANSQYVCEYPLTKEKSNRKLGLDEANLILGEEFVSFIGGLGYKYDSEMRPATDNQDFANTWSLYIELSWGGTFDNRNIAFMFRDDCGSLFGAYEGHYCEN